MWIKQRILNIPTRPFVCRNTHFQKYFLKNYLNTIEIARDLGVK